MCREDILFWFNAFVWTYNPKLPSKDRILPFITWDAQDTAIIEIKSAIVNQYSILAIKSREQGATWIFIGVQTHDTDFELNGAHMMVSRNEKYVDEPGNKKSLFWKLDFIHKHMPNFLWDKSKTNRRSMFYENTETGGTITGEATTSNIARGDRLTSIFIDEFAAFKFLSAYEVDGATLYATDCRLINSTFTTPSGCFYDMAQNPAIHKIRLAWWDHPVQRRGLYQWEMDTRLPEGGRINILDTGYVFPEGYKFIRDGKIRSPYYDRKEAEASNKSAIRAELDMDPEGASSQFFDPRMLDEKLRNDCRDPLQRGDLSYDTDTFEPKGFVPRQNGKLLLWLNLLPNGEPPRGTTYVIGCDICTGGNEIMGSNSVATVVDAQTGEMVAELVTPVDVPDRFAEMVVALCRWFGGAFLIWEDNGPGQAFKRRVISIGYRFFYYREQEDSITRKFTSKPGWWSGPRTRNVLLNEFNRMLYNGEFICRNAEAIREAKKFIYSPTGDIVNSGSLTSNDPAGAKMNHGDRIMSEALCCLALKNVKPRKEDIPKDVKSCVAARYQRMKREQRMAVREGWLS